MTRRRAGVVFAALATLSTSALDAHGGWLRDRLQQRREAHRDGVEQHDIGGRHVAMWVPKGDGPFPLILFSHGFHGCNTQSSALLTPLATAGFLVAAPNHNDAACGEGRLGTKANEPFGEPDQWSDATHRDRARDLSTLLDALRADASWSARIDWTRVGLIGHSLGGYTVLGLAGAWPSWRRPEIKAVVAWSPYCAPFLWHGDLGALHVPVMYQGGTIDLGITPSIRKEHGCFDRTASPAYFVELAGAGHFAWTNLNHHYDEAIAHYTVEFFRKYLGDSAKAALDDKLPDVAELRAK